ncbi:guanylate kinase [Evansella cellulosilytica]|uniref:Guanylate kinase n=1 Tax=Evansella cellulosilytica (strain ATCC 21833 / DSM 2522 / FERM P-1141 / JCM 9156 / N-4) TaxID=649639 RepID=E6TTW7_EVAC2|nr:guanylate kinase [Evansella cellulosilytica]ADU31998.1 guanylate kinase [Evansella cellulosilytica DSM 2522]
MYSLKEKEIIFVFTGPDGSGRKTVSKLVGESTLHMKGVISYTTRERRHYETEGEDYHYISKDEFESARNNGEFLESVEVDGNLYGIKEQDIKNTFEEKGCIYLVLNTEGAEILKKLYGDKVIRFFVYADRNTVMERQKERGDTPEIIERHLAHYDQDMAYKEECEHIFENYKLDHIAFEVTNTIEHYFKLKLEEKAAKKELL